MKKDYRNFLTPAQLSEEFTRCEYCEEKPCKDACPVDCSPADFIMAVSRGADSDYRRASALIMGSNPLGGVCGCVCPDYHCMSACVRKNFDRPINIPAVQATIIQKAKELNKFPEFRTPVPNGKKIAVIGAGPAGIGCASVLAQKGYEIKIIYNDNKGGMCNLIPDLRLKKSVLKTDIEFLAGLGSIFFEHSDSNLNPEKFFNKGYDAVVIATGLDKEYKLNISGEEFTVPWISFLRDRKKFNLNNKKVAVIGGGSVAVDCAVSAKIKNALSVEMICLEKFDEMPLTEFERKLILDYKIEITGRTIVSRILHNGKKVKGIVIQHCILPKGKKFHPSLIRKDINTKPVSRIFDFVIIAIGSGSSFRREKINGIFYTGDMVNGPTTVVEAVASGKNTALKVDAFLNKRKIPKFKNPLKSTAILEGTILIPVPIETDFFGRKILSPFILSAAPPTDGYEQMKKAYESGWAGGVMKTAFDNVNIHIPSEYMFAVTKSTYGNCDNVSGHSLDRVCREVKKLVSEYPDRLTIASTGGPVTGRDEEDKIIWQSNTKKLEQAGIMGIEYSLSCPQGGDGTKGDIVSQDAELTSKIIDWVMEAGNPEIPKLFKLTAAVTSIYPIVSAIKNVFQKYPDKKAGITLANTFPAMALRKGNKKIWEEGIIIGLSGEGVIPISNLTLARVSNMEVAVSGNGGPMDYKSASDFLALGAKTVQFCTIVMKYGYGIINELHSGLSYLLQEKGMKSVKELIGCALPDPITGFEQITSVKKISDVFDSLCEHCGNCTRCPYQAVTLNKNLIPETDASKCIGCSICVQKCFSGAMYMRERTEKELSLLKEN